MIAGHSKTEVINFLGPWKSTLSDAAHRLPWRGMAQVEWQTLKWVAWYNAERIHSAIEYKTPNETENIFYADLNTNEEAA